MLCICSSGLGSTSAMCLHGGEQINVQQQKRCFALYLYDIRTPERTSYPALRWRDLSDRFFDFDECVCVCARACTVCQCVCVCGNQCTPARSSVCTEPCRLSPWVRVRMLLHTSFQHGVKSLIKQRKPPKAANQPPRQNWIRATTYEEAQA